jgi:hypothetical protein
LWTASSSEIVLFSLLAIELILRRPGGPVSQARPAGPLFARTVREAARRGRLLERR